MKVHVTLTDNNGAVFEGEVELAPIAAARGRKKQVKPAIKVKAARTTAPAKLNFAMNPRAFVKAYARNLSGPRKFVLLVAYLTKGALNKEILLSEVKKEWNRMTSRLGTFNPFYTNEAKENGWVDTKKKGGYALTASWTEILER